MKVSLITILDNVNFGTYLQALATCKAIEKVGHQTEVIRYTRWIMTPMGYSLTILKERGLLRWLKRCVINSSKDIFELREKDFTFLKKFVSVTQEYIGFKSLKDNPPIADVYVTGSDQVWNSVYNRGMDNSFYLDFVPMGKKRISYAASIGMSSIPPHEIPIMRGLLEKYSYIAVRESSAVTLLNDVGVHSEVVLDPTLLIDKEEWRKIANVYDFKIEGDYVLTYSVEYGKEDSYIEFYANKIAKEKKLKIYHVSYSDKKTMPKYADKVFPRATPDVFLNLMLNAKFIVVSSFHGTAFAINFNKEFLTVSPQRFSTRIESLLNILDLKTRIIKDTTVEIENLDPIDYNKVNNILNHEREISLIKLKQMIEE